MWIQDDDMSDVEALAVRRLTRRLRPHLKEDGFYNIGVTAEDDARHPAIAHTSRWNFPAGVARQ